MKLNRREFIKISAGATGLALINPLLLARGVHASEDGKEVALLVDVTKCVGCWWCSLACKKCNEIENTVVCDHEEPPPLSQENWTTLYTWKEGDRWRYRRQACMHCTDAACVRICPTGAVRHNEMGFVEFDQDKCSGCGYCVEHCPFSIPKLEGSITSGIGHMNKCVFCIDRVSEGQQPACAEACPTGATKFGYRDELLQEGQARVEELRKTNTLANLYGVNEMGGLHVLYILDNTPEVWGLPSDPNLPTTTILHDVLEWAGMIVVPAVLAGFGFNYLVARIRIAKEAKRERS